MRGYVQRRHKKPSCLRVIEYCAPKEEGIKRIVMLQMALHRSLVGVGIKMMSL